MTGQGDDACTAEPTPQERRALFRVVRGGPSDAEVAALTVVLAATAAAAGPDGAAPRRAALWSAPAAGLRAPLVVGRDAWRSTYWPR